MGEPSGSELEAIGLARHRDGDYLGAIDAYERAHTTYARQGELFSAARAARTVGWFRGWIFGDWAVCRGWLSRARTLLQDQAAEPRHQAWLMLDDAREGHDLGEQQRRYLAVIALARQYGDWDLECEARASLGMMLVFSGNVEDGMGQLDEALAAICAGDVEELPVVEGCLCGLLNACERTNDVTRAEEWLRVADPVVTGRNLVAVAGYCRTHYAGVLIASGRWAEAEAELSATISALPQGLSVRTSALCRLADLRARQGRLEEAAMLLAGLEAHEDAARPLASLHLLQGEPECALELLDQALSVPAEDHVTAPLLALTVRAQLAQRDVDAATAPARQLCAVAHQQASPYIKGIAALAEAALLDARGEPGATPRLRQAVSHLSAARMPFETALARLELARKLVSDRPRAAIAEATAALAAFEEMGATGHADAAAALLRTLGSPSRPGPRDGETLTRREREVLRLLGHGLSNAEIADRLFISAKTVEHHVSRVLAKLGLRNRAEAAVHALRSQQ